MSSPPHRAFDGSRSAAITAESARSLGLTAGRKVVVVIKSTEVMLAVED